MKLRVIVVTIGVWMSASSAHALLSTTTLPEGINSPSIRYGIVDGIDQRYTENGSLMTLGDYKSVVFDSQTLAKFNADAQRLIDALNRFGAHGLGNDFNLGVLRVHTKPQVKYFAPVYARGLTKNWTLGVGLPLVSYKNKISLDQQFSNIDYYREQFSGLSPELDAALNTDLRQATHETLAAKGYRALSNRDESYMGDMQVVSMYRFAETRDSAWVYQAHANLPTGPSYDPDDLAAINIFGRTNVWNTLAYSRKVYPGVTIVPFVAYLVNIPDQITARVPLNADDTLPDANTKEQVNRSIGNTANAGGNIFYEFNDQWTVGAGYDYSMKDADTYSGSKNSRYDLLALNSQSDFHRAKAEVSYSTVNAYFKKTAMIPFIVSYQLSDTFLGLNVERQLTQEMNLMLFF